MQNKNSYYKFSILSLALNFIGSAYCETPPSVIIPPMVNGKPNPSYNGTGCPAGTARVVVSPDLQAFTIIFDQYILNISGSNAKDERNCQILVRFDFPQGWSYSLFRMDYRGFYDLSAGTSGTIQAVYSFLTHAQKTRMHNDLNGPTTGNYTLSDTLEVNDLTWSACKEPKAGLNINTSLSARISQNNPTGYAYITTDSADGHTQNIYNFQWRRCL